MTGPVRWAPGSPKAKLVSGEVHVWAASLDEQPTDVLRGWLSDDERAVADRFHFTRDRRHFVAARGILRELLGRYLGLDPAVLRFAYGPRGKPSLAGPSRDRPHFNLSHSGGLALFAFDADREIGVDVECERPVPEAEAIAERYFSAQEGAVLGRLPEAARLPAFFRCWTRKEAFIKATGDGLSRPLDAFDVTLTPGEPARLLRIEGEPEGVGRWWLEDLEPAEGFAAALAVQGRPTRLACWAWEGSMEGSYGPRRERGQDDLQGGGEPRGTVLDLAG